MRKNPKGKYISINLEENHIPKEIENRSLIIIGDINEILNQVISTIEKNNDL